MERTELDVELVVVADGLDLPIRALAVISVDISTAPSGPWEVELLPISPLKGDVTECLVSACLLTDCSFTSEGPHEGQ